MECNYEPYIQITGTTTFPPIRSNHFQKSCELESLFQQEKCYDELLRDRGRKYFNRNDTRQKATGELSACGGGGGRRRRGDDDVQMAFHERYSNLTPKAFCLCGPDGSKALCLNRKEFEAIVERSRNKNSDCIVLLCPACRCSHDLCDEVCPVRTRSVVECRLTPPMPKPDLCSGRSGKPGRARAGATKAALRIKNEKKNCSNCPRGSCGRPMKCPSQTNDKIPRSTSKPCNGQRRRPLDNSCQNSKINRPPWGHGCCCADVCHRMTSSGSGSNSDKGCRSDDARGRPKECCAVTSSGCQTNCCNLLPPVCGSDSRRTRLRSINLEACDSDRPVCDCNVYEVRPVHCAKIDSTGSYNARENTFNLSAM